MNKKQYHNKKENYKNPKIIKKQMEKINLDEKDYKILKELDINCKTPFSRIAKKVKLSKNSVIKRYEQKIKNLITHQITGINNELLGYKLIKVFYSFNYYDKQIEQRIIKVLKHQKNIIWVAKYYGPFDISIALLVRNLNQLINHINEFNEQFSEQIGNKEIQLINKQIFFRHDYIHKKPIKKIHIEENYSGKTIKLSKTEKKIIYSIINEPRKSIIKISEETNLSTKTITKKIKELEKKRIITGYFITIDNSKLTLDTFKLLIQIKNDKDTKKFEEYLKTIKNIRHIRKMIGLWDYEIDIVYQTNNELHKQIEELKYKFPKIFKKIEIASFEKRIFTTPKDFLFDEEEKHF